MSDSGLRPGTAHHPPHNTALKWGQDGELSRLDLERILELLTQADPVAEALISSISNPES